MESGKGTGMKLSDNEMHQSIQIIIMANKESGEAKRVLETARDRLIKEGWIEITDENIEAFAKEFLERNKP